MTLIEAASTRKFKVKVHVNSRLHLPGEDGHGLLDVDADAGVPRLSAVIQKVVTRKHLLASCHALDVTKI